MGCVGDTRFFEMHQANLTQTCEGLRQYAETVVLERLRRLLGAGARRKSVSQAGLPKANKDAKEGGGREEEGGREVIGRGREG